MRFVTLALSIAALGVPAHAQVLPAPTEQSPRIQEAIWQEGQSVLVTALPQTPLTILLDDDQAIRRATISDSEAWGVSVSADLDSISVLPATAARPADLIVETDTREYRFRLEAAQSLMAAYLVRISNAPAAQTQAEAQVRQGAATYSYRLRGDRSVRPAAIVDDGEKTIIDYVPGQSLPAVFAIGPSGDEEVVDGYMRGDRFVIDRVHQELIFRIDKEKATAKRNKQADGAS